MATWNPSEREAAIARGKAGGELSGHERDKLEEASRQTGRSGDNAREALRKAR